MTTQVLDTKREKAGLPLATDRRRWSRYTNAANLRVLVLASFAAGLFGGVAREFSVPLGTAGHMATVYAVADHVRGRGPHHVCPRIAFLR